LSGGKNGTLRDDTSAGTICVTINWKEVCKFLSGAFFVSAGVLNGVRAAVHAVLFAVFFYLGYIRK
jgi:hypothetical protein